MPIWFYIIYFLFFSYVWSFVAYMGFKDKEWMGVVFAFFMWVGTVVLPIVIDVFKL